VSIKIQVEKRIGGGSGDQEWRGILKAMVVLTVHTNTQNP
jgi:hypothetical protein